MIGFWIDIEDGATGEKYGVIHSATSWQSSPELSKAGTFSFSLPLDSVEVGLIAAKRVARCYAIVAGAVQEVGAGVIDRKEAIVTTSPATWRVSGSDLLRELSYRSVFDLELYTDTEASPTSVKTYIVSVPTFYNKPSMHDDDLATYDGIDALAASGDFIYIGHSEPFNFLRWNFEDDGGGDKLGNSDASDLNYGYSDGAAGWPELDVIYDETIVVSGGTSTPYPTALQSPESVPVWYDVFFQKDGGTWALETVDSVSAYWVRIDPTDAIENFWVRELYVVVRSPLAADLSAIMAYAPTAWASWGGDADGIDIFTSTTNGTYAQFAGETVLNALVKIAKKNGESFRIASSGRKLHWLRALTSDAGAITAPTSGITAVQDTGAPDLIDNPNVCIITSLSVVEDTHELITRIYPYGAGNGPARVTLVNATETMPTGYVMDTTNNYIKRTAAETAYGVIERGNVSFKDVHPTGTTTFDGTETCNNLAIAALNYLKRHSVEQTFLQLTVANLSQRVLVGDTIKVVYREFYDGVETLAVDDDFIILSATTQITADGIETTALKVGTADYWPATDGEITAQVLESGIVYEAHPQPVDSRQVKTV